MKNLSGTTTSDFTQMLPSSLSADTIILQTKETLTIKDTDSLTASKKLELISVKGVYVFGSVNVKAGDSDGKIDNFIVNSHLLSARNFIFNRK